MKKLFIVVILLLHASAVFGGEIVFEQESRLETEDGWIVVSLVPITIEDGKRVGAYASRFIFSINPEGRIDLLDKLDGHSVTFKEVNFNNIGNRAIAAFFYAGGNQFVFNGYYKSGDSLEKFKSPALASNMRSIQLFEDGIVTVRNLDTRESERVVVVEVYKVTDDYSFSLIQTYHEDR